MADHDDDDDASEERVRISHELTRELVLSSLAAVSGSEKSAGKPLKMTNDAVLAAAELLRLFVVEARGRAAVEAECEAEGAGAARVGDSPNGEDGASGGKVLIGAHHITKLAAELLMEFS